MTNSFISSDQPMKIDGNVFGALGEDFEIADDKFPLVKKWFNAMRHLHAKTSHRTLNNFRIVTPKLKFKAGLQS